MSRWADAFTNSNLEKNIQKVKKQLKLAIFKNVASTYSAEVKRLNLFIGIAETVCKKVDPDIMPHTNVLALSNVINVIYTHLVNYINTEGPTYLQAAADQVDTGISHLQPISLVLGDKPVVSNTALKGLLQKVTEYITQFTKKRAEFSSTVSGLKRQVATQEKKVRSIDRDALRKVKDLEKQIADFNKRFDKLQTDSKKEFQSDQTKRKSTFNTQLINVKKTLTKEHEQLLSRMNRDIEKQRNKIIDELEELKQASIQKHEELISIVGLASGDAMRAQHKIAAESEEESVSFWRRVSFGSILTAVIYIGSTTYSKGMSPDTSIMMAPLLILLLSGSAYAARIAAGHRKEAIRVRQFSLEMEAILPYLDALERSPEDSKELRNKLAEKFFGNLPHLEGKQHNNETHITDMTIQKISEMLHDLLNAVRKK
jgi:hypothetical protein